MHPLLSLSLLSVLLLLLLLLSLSLLLSLLRLDVQTHSNTAARFALLPLLPSQYSYGSQVDNANSTSSSSTAAPGAQSKYENVTSFGDNLAATKMAFEALLLEFKVDM